MKRTLIITLLVLGLIVNAPAQKRKTIWGDTWTGHVVAANETTREITIEYPEKDKQLRFTGILREGYKIQMIDGSYRELRFSEISIGMRVQLITKKEEQTVGAGKVKINKILRIDFLGKDDYAKLRTILKVDPDLTVELVKSPRLPATSPLKIYAQIESPGLAQRFLNWTSAWNSKEATKHGAVEVVSSLNGSDVSLIVYRGDVWLAPLMYTNGERIDFGGDTVQTFRAYLVRHQEGKLEILWWKPHIVVLPKTPLNTPGIIEKELEKKLKAKR